MKSLKKLLTSLRVKNNFVITTHLNMEGDALGSELAFYSLLKVFGKKAIVINDHSVCDEYSFLPLVGTIKKFDRIITPPKCDYFVTLDCADLERCGKVASLIRKGKSQVINIDHHISNEKYGDINWVEPEASSTSEMVYTLFKKLHIPFTKEIATLLYVGLMTDTGSFHYSNTSRKTHRAVVELLRYGINVTDIYKNVYENIAFKDMKVLNEIAGTMQRSLGGKLVWIKVPRATIRQLKGTFDLSEHLLSFARAIRKVEVAVLFKENAEGPNKIRVNLRSQGKIDVSKIAMFFGGGGHRAASGCTIEDSLANAEKIVLARVRWAIKS